MTPLRGGFTTGTCAAAASKAAAILLSGEGVPISTEGPDQVEVTLPDGAQVTIPLLYSKRVPPGAEAAVRKDAGDDPDVTHGATIVATVSWSEGNHLTGQGDHPTGPGEGVTLVAGEGVGTVTKPGLSVKPGEPAINPVPRQMIRDAIREVTERAVKVILSIPGGRELARKTFNPRLGVAGGLSILGTTGRVCPYSCPALRESLKCSLKVAAASGIARPVLVPGHIGERAARRHFYLAPDQVIQVSNEWGYMLDHASQCGFESVLILGHPGKLAKLPAGQWNTHSSHSKSAAPMVASLAEKVLGHSLPESSTVEGLMEALPLEERQKVAERVADDVREAVAGRLKGNVSVAVILVNMEGEILGASGELDSWR